MAEDPPDGEEDGPEAFYVYDAFRLEPFGDLIQEGPDRVMIADLKQITSFCGDWGELLRLRAAKMSAAGRRQLRIKLARYFGRSTDEDRTALAEQGIPTGTPTFSPSPEQTSLPNRGSEAERELR